MLSGPVNGVSVFCRHHHHAAQACHPPVPDGDEPVFVELLLIRWIPANVIYVGFFRNFL
jgi:hypothetical protein